jgi:hypothetical protein
MACLRGSTVSYSGRSQVFSGGHLRISAKLEPRFGNSIGLYLDNVPLPPLAVTCELLVLRWNAENDTLEEVKKLAAGVERSNGLLT